MSSLRDFVAVKETRMLEGLLIGVVVMAVFWSVQATFGYGSALWAPDWGITSFVGGFVFGVGMTVAGGCAAGTLYRAGRGDLKVVLTTMFVFVGHVAFAYAYPVLRDSYFQPLRFGEGVSIYHLLPWPLAVTGLLATLVVGGGYAFARGRASRRRPGTGQFEWQGTTERGVTGTIRFGLVELGRGIRDHVVAIAEDDRRLRERFREPWDARSSGIAMALVASVWFWAHGAWGIAKSESRWAAWLLDSAGALDADDVLVIMLCDRGDRYADGLWNGYLDG